MSRKPRPARTLSWEAAPNGRVVPAGLPIIGKLLGHSQASTTARYAHLDNDPLRRATEAIGKQIAAALDGRKSGAVVPLKDRRV
jgi:integrase